MGYFPDRGDGYVGRGASGGVRFDDVCGCGDAAGFRGAVLPGDFLSRAPRVFAETGLPGEVFGAAVEALEALEGAEGFSSGSPGSSFGSSEGVSDVFSLESSKVSLGALGVSPVGSSMVSAGVLSGSSSGTSSGEPAGGSSEAVSGGSDASLLDGLRVLSVSVPDGYTAEDVLAAQALLLQYSPVHHITSDTPPTLLFHSINDGVDPENSLRYYEGLVAAGVPAELHLFPSGGHGWGFNTLATAGYDRLAPHRPTFFAALDAVLTSLRP